MRACLAGLLVLASCFPDADKLRGGSGPIVNPPAGGSGGFPATGGTPATGGAGGGSAGTGGAGGMATGGMGGMGMGGTGGVSPARAALCAEWATATAEKAFTCAPFTQAFRYGSKDGHAARLRVNCNIYDLPQVQFPPSPFKPCADALVTLNCRDWIDGVIPPPCLGLGALPAGASCASSYQCQTDLCDLQANGCGKCVVEPGAGQPCFRDSICALGLTCNPAKICVAPGRAGAACDANAPCADSLGCSGGKCAALGAPGAACMVNEQCDIYHGSVCDRTGTKCVPVTIGPMCMLNQDGSYVFCGASATCRSGTCIPAAADGAACSTGTEGPQCLWPASCTSANICRLFQPNRSCPIGAQRPTETGPGLLPAPDGVRALWRSLVPRPAAHEKF